MNNKLGHGLWMDMTKRMSKVSTCRVDLACILIKKNRQVGIGYTGAISGDDHCNDKGCIFINNYNEHGTSNSGKSCVRTVHAEINALIDCKERGEKDNWLICYSTYSPCINCLVPLLQIGVRQFVYEKFCKDNRVTEYLAGINKDLRAEITFLHWLIAENKTKV